MKILEKEKIKDKKDVERITREIKILKKVRHPNVIQLYEVSHQLHQIRARLFIFDAESTNIDHRDREGSLHDHGVLGRRGAI